VNGGRGVAVVSSDNRRSGHPPGCDGCCERATAGSRTPLPPKRTLVAGYRTRAPVIRDETDRDEGEGDAGRSSLVELREVIQEQLRDPKARAGPRPPLPRPLTGWRGRGPRRRSRHQAESLPRTRSVRPARGGLGTFPWSALDHVRRMTQRWPRVDECDPPPWRRRSIQRSRRSTRRSQCGAAGDLRDAERCPASAGPERTSTNPGR
jgi:hypothetical protein